MKILVLIDWFAPAFKGGGPIQSVMNMVQNGDGAYQYRIICSNQDLDHTILPVTPDAWIKYNADTEVWYSSRNKDVLKIVNNTIEEWQADALFINGIYSLYYNFLPILFAKPIRKIISVRGTLHDGALSQKPFKKKLFIGFWKFFNLHHKHEFHASAPEEKGFVEKVFGRKTKVFVAANFPKRIKFAAYPEKKQNCLNLISVALISPMKNHLHVLEALQNCSNNICYEIYGPVKDPLYWQKCLEQIQKLPKNVIVRYMGELSPFKVEEVLNTAHVFILPSKSENFGHAIYEALISGKPVITSHKTPWNGLQEAKAGINVTPESGNEIKEAVDFFASMNADEFSAWSLGANNYAEEMINVQTIKEQYKKMFLSPLVMNNMQKEVLVKSTSAIK